VARGARIGSVTVLADDRPIARVPLLLAHALPAVSSLARAGEFLSRASTLLPLILVLGAAATAAVFRRQRSRAKAAAASR
jgi:hypothetical protein